MITMTLDEFFSKGYKLHAGDKLKHVFGSSFVVAESCIGDYNDRSPNDKFFKVLKAKVLDETIPQTKEVEWENGELLEYKDEDDEWSTDGRYVCFDKFADHHVFYAANMTLYHACDEQIRKPEAPGAKKEREELEAAYDLYCDYTNANTVDATCMGRSEFRSSHKAAKWISTVRKTGYRVEK